MFDTAPQLATTPGPALAGALARVAAAVARLDQALMGHPLAAAFLHRARLDAVRRQAAVDGQLIDPWHLAAVLEGLRLRMEGELRIIDRGAIIEAARHALVLHQWLHEPDFDQEGEVQAAEAALAAAATADDRGAPLLAAAHWLHAWLDEGRGRAPARGALVRLWRKQGLLRAPVPLTGAAALRADAPWTPVEWVPVFLPCVGGGGGGLAGAAARHGAQLAASPPHGGGRAAQHLARRGSGGRDGGRPFGFGHLARPGAGHGDEERGRAAGPVPDGGRRGGGDAPLGAAAVGIARARAAARRGGTPAPAGAGTRAWAAAAAAGGRRAGAVRAAALASGHAAGAACLRLQRA